MHRSNRSRRLAAACAGLAASLLLAPAALAQDAGPDRPGRPDREAPGRMDEARLKIVWTWQAREVAGEIGLDEAGTEALVQAWTGHRAALAAAMEEIRREAREARGGEGAGRGRGDGGGAGAGRGRGGGGGAGAGRGRGGGVGAGGPQGGPMAELREKMQAKTKALETELQAKVVAVAGAEGAKKAMKAFTAENRSWDRMADAILSMELEEPTTRAALGAVRRHAESVSQLRGGDREAMREGMRSARATLEMALGEILGDEGVAAFRQKLRAGDRRGGRRGQRGAGRA